MTKWATVQEVADSFNVTERTVRRWIAAGDLPSVKIGGSRRIPLVTLEAQLLKKAHKCLTMMRDEHGIPYHE